MLISYINQQEITQGEEIKADKIRREVIFNFIKIDFPHFDKNDYISIYELNQYRKRYFNFLIEQETATFDKSIAERVRVQGVFSESVEDEIDTQSLH